MLGVLGEAGFGTSRCRIQIAGEWRPAELISWHGVTGYLPESAQNSEVTAEMVDEVLRVLHLHSLIDHDRDRTSLHREVRVHQLIQRATRENLTSQPDLGPDLFAALADTAADALRAVWPGVERDELGQILRANTTALERATGTTLWDTDGVPAVLRQGAFSLVEAGHITAALAAYTELASVADERLAPEHPDTLGIYGGLVYVQGTAGDKAAAVVAHEELLAKHLKVLGPHHLGTLQIRFNLARLSGCWVAG